MKLHAWWQQRQSRERLVLVTAGGVLACLLVYLLLEPVIEEQARMAAELPQLQADLDWMLANAADLQQLRDGQGTTSNPAGQGLSPALVQSLLREMRLEGAASDLGTAINRGVSLDFSVVSYPDLVEFLYQVRNRSDARISEAGITQLAGQPGMVRARIVFRPADPL